jgi:hypothetical protein
VKAFASAQELYLTLSEPELFLARSRHLARIEEYQRIALAHRALAAIRLSRDDAAGAIRHRKSVITIQSRIMHMMVYLATDRPKPIPDDLSKKDEDDNPFTVAPAPADKTGKDELSKDAVMAKKTDVHPFDNKFLCGIQWKGAEVSHLFTYTIRDWNSRA